MDQDRSALAATTFLDLVAGGAALPRPRAERCEAEYHLAVSSLHTLFRRHLRGGRLERARVRRAFRGMF